MALPSRGAPLRTRRPAHTNTGSTTRPASPRPAACRTAAGPPATRTACASSPAPSGTPRPAGLRGPRLRAPHPRRRGRTAPRCLFRGVTAPESSAHCCEQVRAPLKCTVMHALLFVAVTVSLRSQWPRKVSLVAGLTRAWREARLTLPSHPPPVAQISCMQVVFGGRTCDAHACEIVEQRRGRIHRHDDDQRRRAGNDLPGRAPSQQQSPLLARLPCVWTQGTHRRTRSHRSAHHACSATIRVALQTGLHLLHIIYSLLLWHSHSRRMHGGCDVAHAASRWCPRARPPRPCPAAPPRRAAARRP